MHASEPDSWFQEFSWEGNGSGSDSARDDAQCFLRLIILPDLFACQT
jgi:hypothetical protein